MASVALPDIPSEIIQKISTYMSYSSRLALRFSCCKLYAKADWPNRPANGYSMADLLEIEQWPEYCGAKILPPEHRQLDGRVDFFACHLCLKILSADKFANAMMKGKRGKLGEERTKRFCLQCGITHRRYQRGTCLRFGGASRQHGFMCCSCGKFELGKRDEVPVPGRRCANCY